MHGTDAKQVSLVERYIVPKVEPYDPHRVGQQVPQTPATAYPEM